MKTIFSKLALISVIACLTFPVLAQKSNFSGSWNLNESKSNFGEARFRMAASKITAIQEANLLKVQSVSKNQNGDERTSNDQYTLDGTECENTLFQNFVRKSRVSWSPDGKSLIINSVMNFERDGEKREFKSSDIWKISDDGKTLIIQSKYNTPNGEMTQTKVYDKV